MNQEEQKTDIFVFEKGISVAFHFMALAISAPNRETLKAIVDVFDKIVEGSLRDLHPPQDASAEEKTAYHLMCISMEKASEIAQDFLAHWPD